MQQDVEQRLISVISNEKIFGDVVVRGVGSEDFIIHTEVFSFIQTYYGKYNTIPAKAVIESSFPGFEYINDVKEHEIKYLCEELIKSTTKRKAIVYINESSELLSVDPYGAIDSLVNKLTNIRKTSTFSRSFADADAPKRYAQAVENKAKVAKGNTVGLKTGISFFDKQFLGWQPGNLIGIVGRLTSGKSCVAQYLACQTYNSGKRVLFLSPEMSAEEVNLKWDTFMGRMQGHTFLNDKLPLGDVNLKEYKQWLDDVSVRKDWLTLDSANGKKFNLSNIKGFISEFSPDLVVVDGVALLEGVGMESWLKMMDVSYGLKSLAQNQKIVIIATAQANRSVEANEMPRPDQVSFGDAFMQACLVPGTIIRRASKPQGYFPIEEIKEGDLVFTHEGRSRKVIKTMNRKIKEEIYKLYLDNYEVIKITGNHELYTKDGWVEAKDLNTNHILYKLSDVSKMGSTRPVPSYIKGKTWEEYHGSEKAEERRKQTKESMRIIRRKQVELGTLKTPYVNGHEPHNKNKTLEELYGADRAMGIREEMSVSRVGMNLGDENPNWRDGASALPYSCDFSRARKQNIKDRDGHVCQLCGIDELLTLEKTLFIHHIDYDKMHSDEENLIALCNACNSKVNGDRVFWTKYFQGKMVAITNGTQILKIEKEFYDGDVYNLEVEEDHSYCGNGIIYHNCDVGIFLQHDTTKPNLRFYTIPKRRNGKAINIAQTIQFDVNKGIIEM